MVEEDTHIHISIAVRGGTGRGGMERRREGEREGGRERGREGGREGGKEGGRWG